jgi:hypothetical protein
MIGDPRPANERRDRRLDTWKRRALEATQGNHSLLGTILIAALGNDVMLEPLITDLFGPQGFQAPRFRSGGHKYWGATINPDGLVNAVFTEAGERWYRGGICMVGDLIANFRGLAEHLKLDQKEAEELFAVVRGWIKHDLRREEDKLYFHKQV